MFVIYWDTNLVLGQECRPWDVHVIETAEPLLDSNKAECWADVTRFNAWQIPAVVAQSTVPTCYHVAVAHARATGDCAAAAEQKHEADATVQ